MSWRTAVALGVWAFLAGWGAVRLGEHERRRLRDAARDAAVQVEAAVSGRMVAAAQDPVGDDVWWPGMRPLGAPGTLSEARGRLATEAAATPGSGARVVGVLGEWFVVVPTPSGPPVVLSWDALAARAEGLSGGDLHVGERPPGGAPVLQDVLGGAPVWLVVGPPAARVSVWVVAAAAAAAWAGVVLARAGLDRHRARAADDARRTLLERLSHELRTPAAAVRALASALRSGAAAGQETEFLRLLDVEADRLATGLDQVLRTARGDDERRQEPRRNVDLTELVRELAARWSARVGPIEVRADGPVWAVVDRAAVVEALEAVLDNAFVHGTPPVRLEVEAAEPRLDRVGIAVVDAGGGIAPEDRERVVRRGEGRFTGLGLWVADRVARAHGGRLHIDGARVAIEVPARAPSEVR